MSKKLTPRFWGRFYFAQILDLKEVLDGEADRFLGFSIIEDWFLLVDVDTKPVKVDCPIELKTAWKPKFSEVVQKHLDIIASSN